MKQFLAKMGLQCYCLDVGTGIGRVQGFMRPRGVQTGETKAHSPSFSVRLRNVKGATGSFSSTQDTCHYIDRGNSVMRNVYVLAAAALVLVFTFLEPSTSMSQPTIRLGFVYVFSGRLAHYGYGAKQGAQMAMDEINQAGGINGRKLEGFFADTKLKPDVGVKAVTKLVREHQVDIVLGIVSSGVASAVAPVMNSLETPLIITLAMTPDVTGKICNPYTFRISMDGPQNIKGASILAAGMENKKWTTIGPDYLFGYQCWEYFQRYLKEKRPDVAFASKSEICYIPVTASDFTPAIDKIMKSDADAVLVSLYGGNLIDFIHQGNEKGFFTKERTVLMNLAYSAEVMLGLGLALPKGVWLSGLYWFEANSTPANLRFVAQYKKRYKFLARLQRSWRVRGGESVRRCSAESGNH